MHGNCCIYFDKIFLYLGKKTGKYHFQQLQKYKKLSRKKNSGCNHQNIFMITTGLCSLPQQQSIHPPRFSIIQQKRGCNFTVWLQIYGLA